MNLIIFVRQTRKGLLQNYAKMTRNKTYSPSTVFMMVFFLSIGILFGCGEEVKIESIKIGESKKEETLPIPEPKSKDIILCFGNSLTEGYGLKSEEAYPALLQGKVDSAALSYTVVNAGLSGETTSGGKGRLNWVLQSQAQNDIKIFILELGPNDGLRGIKLDATKKNLQSIIDTVKVKIPEAKIVLAGMKIPPNMGPEYTAEFQTIFPALADSNNIALIPFLLEGVAGDPELNQEDGIHPTPEGTKIVIENVWKVVKPLLE